MSPHWPTQTMLYQKRLNQQTVDDVSQSHSLSRHLPMMPGVHTLTEQIEEGSFYEIDRSKLPPRTPSLLLHSVRVVMVTVKTDQHVTVRYPSIKSLEAYFVGPSENLYPEMDEKFIMGSQLAVQVLARRISSREFTGNSSSKAFWLVQSLRTEMVPVPLKACDSANNVKSKVGTCLSRLQCSNIKSWGERRLVCYVRNVEKNYSDQQSSNNSSHIKVEKSEMQEEGEASADFIESEERRYGSSVKDGQQVSGIVHVEGQEIKKEKEDEVYTRAPRLRKRKQRSYAKSRRMVTMDLVCMKIDSQSEATQKQDRDNFRWSAQRYESAKNELLAVMKARNAGYQNPISRHALRAEARKRIGDTGLLDHLLKHVVDTLAPGGTERFKRRWDSHGVMEYWLESADLDDIRKKAGVQDPYWTPPPGWKPGDPICNHGSDCGAVISALKEELAQLRGEMQVTTTQKQEDRLANLSLLNCVGTVETSTGLNPATFKERYDDLLKEKARREQELLQISKSLKKMELLMRKQSEGWDG